MTVTTPKPKPPAATERKATTAQAPDDLMRAKDVADMLCLTPNAIYVMRTRGVGPPAYKVSGHLLFSRSEVLGWVANQRDAPEDSRT